MLVTDGPLRLVNKTNAPIREIHVRKADATLELAQARRRRRASRQRRHEVRLPHLPLRQAAGAGRDHGLTFKSRLWRRGFRGVVAGDRHHRERHVREQQRVRADHRHEPQQSAQRPHEAPPPASSARASDGEARGHGGDPPQLYRRRLGHVGHPANHRRRPDSDGAGQPGVGRHARRAADRDLRQHRADPQLLLDPVGRLQGRDRRTTTASGCRSTITPATTGTCPRCSTRWAPRSIIIGRTSARISSIMRGSSNSRAITASPRRSPARCPIRNRSASSPTPTIPTRSTSRPMSSRTRCRTNIGRIR